MAEQDSEVSAKKAQATPGPWEVRDSWKTWPHHAGDKQREIVILAADTSESSICHVASVAPENTTVQERELANARLIAAAPDLLSALRELNRAWNATQFPCSDRMDAALKDADGAIAKAEGRT